MMNNYAQQQMAVMNVAGAPSNVQVPSSVPIAQSSTNIPHTMNGRLTQNHGAYFAANHAPQFHANRSILSPQPMQDQRQILQNLPHSPQQSGMTASSYNLTFGYAPDGASPQLQNAAPYLQNDLNHIPGGNSTMSSAARVCINTHAVQQSHLTSAGYTARPQSSQSSVSSNTPSAATPSLHTMQAHQRLQTSPDVQLQQSIGSINQSLPTGHSPNTMHSSRNGQLTASPGLLRNATSAATSSLPHSHAPHGVPSSGHMAASGAMPANLLSSSSPPTGIQQPYNVDPNILHAIYLQRNAQQSRQPQQDIIKFPASSPQHGTSRPGSKRPAPDASEDNLPPSKKLATPTSNVLQGQIQQIQPQTRNAPVLQAQSRAQQKASQQAQAGVLAQNQELLAAQWKAARMANANAQQVVDLQQKAATQMAREEKIKALWALQPRYGTGALLEQKRKEKTKTLSAQADQERIKSLSAEEKQDRIKTASTQQQQEKLKAFREQAQRAVAEKKQQDLRAKEALRRHQEAHQENVRMCEARKQHMEKAKRAARKAELRGDPSALFRHYHEYIGFFPIPRGERKSQYHATLLANRPKVGESQDEYELARQYAKDNWECYYQYPKDTELCARLQREKMEKEEAHKQSLRTTTTNK